MILLSAFSSNLARSRGETDPENPSIQVEREPETEETSRYSKREHCLWISVISAFPLIYCGLYFFIKYAIVTSKEAAMLALPNMVRVSSSGPAGELYPDSLGDYKLMAYVTHNDLPVYQHSTRDDRYIIGNGNIFRKKSLLTKYFINLENNWFISHEISNSGLREFISNRTEDGQFDFDWQYNKYPNCKTQTGG